MRFLVIMLALFFATGVFASNMRHLQYQGLPYCQVLVNPDVAGNATLA